jgi:2'-5' RNA ligase
MRLFIAIELPDAVREHVAKLIDALRPAIGKASFTRVENLHITLKFLGETDERKLDELNESLKLIRIPRPIPTLCDKIECFPNRGPVRIVAAGFGGELAAMKSLHQSIEQRCHHLGFERETRAYRPHVTIARARPILNGSIRSHVAQQLMSLLPGPSFEIAEIAVVRSHLQASGSRYEIIARHALLPSPIPRAGRDQA